MSIKTKIAALALATLAVTGSIASTTKAEAKGFGWGIGAGLIGAAVVGSAIAANEGYITTAIAAAAGFASSTPTATTSAAPASATDADVI